MEAKRDKEHGMEITHPLNSFVSRVSSAAR